jgi:hypothetical protein
LTIISFSAMMGHVTCKLQMRFLLVTERIAL